MKPYQKARIDLIKKLLPNFGNGFVLKGGTALMLYYGLDRYSEDIDLDAFEEMNIVNRIYNPGYKTWNIRIAKDTPTVFRVLIDYGAESDLGNYPLKIEVSSRNAKMLKNNLFKVRNIEGVSVYEVDELINMKVATFGHRDKIRDFYDLGHLLKSYPEHFDENMLKSIMANIQYKGLDNLSLLLTHELETYNLANIPPDDFVLDVYLRCENILLDKAKSQEQAPEDT